ncbi:hypothetical protein [Phaeovulum sp.]|uniref:hypothetical protein n=1 Tax=Phaeovulum sp. TaxID=2934796 RepID=UPI0039E5C636
MITTKSHTNSHLNTVSSNSGDEMKICFVGSSMQFPDTVLRTVQTEIAPAHTLRLLSLSAMESPEFQDDNLCAIVVDEQNAEDLIISRSARQSPLGRVCTVIAYMHQVLPKTCYSVTRPQFARTRSVFCR